MKAFCKTCGTHFPADFEITVGDDCSFWDDRGLYDLPEKYKRLIWDWLFALPVDQIFGDTKYLIGVQLMGRKASIKQRVKFAWHRIVKGYNKMTEAERQAAQKDYYQKQFNGGDHAGKRKST